MRRAIAAGVGAVVVKSTNEREGGKDQLQRAEFAVLDELWRPVPWDASAPMSATIATRSGSDAAAVRRLAGADRAARPRGRQDRLPMRSRA